MMPYEKIFESMPFQGWVADIVDGDYVFSRNNVYHKKMTGIDFAGLTLKDLEELWGWDETIAPWVRSHYDQCVRSRDFIQYEEMVPIDGKDEYWITRLAPVIENDKVVQVVGFTINVTELKEAVKNMEQFIHIISHDMQTPISSINGLVGLLEEQYGKNELTQTIKKSAKEANDQIAGLLQYSRSARLDKSEFGWLDVNKIVDKAVDLIDCSQKNVVRHDLPRCFGNEKAIFTVFHNILTNACKYNNNECPEIKIDGKVDSDKVVYSVADDGIGISKRNADKVFEPFRRLHSKQKYDGNGLGLSIAKAIIQRHGGLIWLTSPNEMGGTTFYFSVKS